MSESRLYGRGGSGQSRGRTPPDEDEGCTSSSSSSLPPFGNFCQLPSSSSSFGSDGAATRPEPSSSAACSSGGGGGGVPPSMLPIGSIQSDSGVGTSSSRSQLGRASSGDSLQMQLSMSTLSLQQTEGLPSSSTSWMPITRQNFGIEGEKIIVNVNKGTKQMGNAYVDDIEANARILQPPTLGYGENLNVTPCRDGYLDMGSFKMIKAATITCWAVINFSHLEQNKVMEFCCKVIEMGKENGMTFGEQIGAYKSVSIDKMKEALETLGPSKRLLFVILPRKSERPKYFYDTVKTICDTQLGVASQCCNPETIEFAPKGIHGRISLQINVKLGGCNFSLQGTCLSDNKGETMIIGADVTHPEANDKYRSSIAAVVALTNWPMVTPFETLLSSQSQPGRNIEMIEKFQDLVKQLLGSHMDKNGRLPNCIVYYRDGVGISEFQRVLQLELAMIFEAYALYDTQKKPKITFIMAQKKCHTRFLTRNDPVSSLPPGTVVDTEICDPHLFDFYMCSQKVSKGTARATHYNILHDDNGFTADQLHMLTNSLSYISPTSTTSNSLVAPVLYAHLAASRARCYIEPQLEGETTLPDIHDVLKNTMFYI